MEYLRVIEGQDGVRITIEAQKQKFALRVWDCESGLCLPEIKFFKTLRLAELCAHRIANGIPDNADTQRVVDFLMRKSENINEEGPDDTAAWEYRAHIDSVITGLLCGELDIEQAENELGMNLKQEGKEE